MNKEIANDYCESVRKLKNDIERAFLSLGSMLYKIRTEELWKGQYESFSYYLEDIQMQQSVASRLIAVYEKMILEWKVDEEKLLQAGGWSNCYETLSLANNKETAEALLDRIAPLNSTDKRLVLREARTGIDSDTCEHDWLEIHMKQCRKCGIREKIFNDN